MFNIVSLVLAQAEAPPKAPGGIGSTVLFAVAIFAVLYFLMIRPQKKKEKARRELINSVQKGEKVVTIGGIHGEVLSIKDNTVILLVDSERNGTLKMNRAAIHRVVSEDTEEEYDK